MKKIISISLLCLVGGCAGGGHQSTRQMNGLNSTLPSQVGGRIGAVLMTQEDCSAGMGQRYLGETETSNGVYPGQTQAHGNDRSTVPTSSGVSARRSNTNWGIIKLLSIQDHGGTMGGLGITDQRRTATLVNRHFSGYAAYRELKLPGIRRTGANKSQIAFTPDRSVLMVSRTEDNSVSFFGVGDHGSLQWQGDIPTGQHPSDIDTAMTTMGVRAAVVHELGVDLFAFNRVSASGNAIADRLYSLPFGNFAGRPTSVAFEPGENGSEAIIVTVSGSRGQFSTTSGDFYRCQLDKYNLHGESLGETSNRGGLPRGCEIDQWGSRFGRQNGIVGTPIKLAVGMFDIAAALSESGGPILIDTRRFPYQTYSLPSHLGYGPVNAFGQGQGRGRGSVDIAIHPDSENIMVLEENRLVTYAMENFYNVGQTDGAAIQIAQKASAMAVDPSGQFLLVADEGAGSVAIARIEPRTPIYESSIQLNACPIDVAIGSERNFQNLPPHPSTNNTSGSADQ